MGSNISTFKQSTADEICKRLSKGEPLASICQDSNMPATRTVSHWTDAHPDFKADFGRARDDGFDAIALDCMRIADDISKDTIETDFGPKMNAEWVARCKLQIETRLKLLAKWDPRRYGEKVEIEHQGGNSLLDLVHALRGGLKE